MKRAFVFTLVFLLLFTTLASAKVVEIKEDGPFTKIKIIHENKPDQARNNPGKPDKPDKPGNGGPGGEKIRCDSSADLFLDSPTYYLNPSTIPSNLNQTFVVNALIDSTKEWDQHTSTDLFIDTPNLDNTKTAGGTMIINSTVYPDFENVIVFGSLDSGTIGVTYVTWWTATGEIADWDMILNTNYAWGDAETETEDVMDLQNILTHELGHSLGLIDLYNKKKCSTVTMFGYSGYNDIEKRTLANDDISSLLKVYSI